MESEWKENGFCKKGGALKTMESHRPFLQINQRIGFNHSITQKIFQ